MFTSGLKMRSPLLIVLLLPFLSGVTLALAAEIVFPTLSGRVVDQAGLLSAKTERALAETLKAHEDKTSHQVVVVTLESLQGQTIEDFGYQLGRHWGIGRKEHNNGVLLIVAPSERKVRIEVGYGLEGVLTDAVAKSIIDTVILPRFKANNMIGGIFDGVKAMLPVLEGIEYAPAPEGEEWFTGAHLLLLILFGMVLWTFISEMRKGSPRDRRDTVENGENGDGGGYFGGYRGGGGGGSGLGGGFGGGFGGGGGGFGGGGASGGW